MLINIMNLLDIDSIVSFLRTCKLFRSLESFLLRDLNEQLSNSNQLRHIEAYTTRLFDGIKNIHDLVENLIKLSKLIETKCSTEGIHEDRIEGKQQTRYVPIRNCSFLNLFMVMEFMMMGYIEDHHCWIVQIFKEDNEYIYKTKEIDIPQGVIVVLPNVIDNYPETYLRQDYEYLIKVLKKGWKYTSSIVKIEGIKEEDKNLDKDNTYQLYYKSIWNREFVSIEVLYDIFCFKKEDVEFKQIESIKEEQSDDIYLLMWIKEDIISVIENKIGLEIEC